MVQTVQQAIETPQLLLDKVLDVSIWQVLRVPKVQANTKRMAQDSFRTKLQDSGVKIFQLAINLPSFENLIAQPRLNLGSTWT